MRKITLLIAGFITAIQLSAVDPSWTRVWENSATLSTNPAYIGTGSMVRGMGVGVFETEKVVVVPTREGGNAVKLLKASDGTEWKNLNVTGIAGGVFAICDAGVTTDGKILVANMVNAAASVFKVYQWNNSTDAPTVAISYTLDAAHRIGDHITVKGSIADGSAKVFAMSTALVSTKATLFRFDMVSDGSGGFVFNSTPTIITNQVSLTGGYNSIDLMPDNSYLFKYNGSQMMKLNADGTANSEVSSSSVIATGGNSVRYLLTKPAVISSDPDTAYVAYFRYGAGQERANIVKFPNGTLNSPAAAVCTYLPALGTNANGNGAGRVAIDDVTANSLNLYVLSTNNGLGKYSISWPDITTSVQQPAGKILITLSADQLSVQNATASSIEIFNTVGQKVKSVINTNEVSVAGLSGVYIVQVKEAGMTVKTQKLYIH